jgi:hypothetical protein
MYLANLLNLLPVVAAARHSNRADRSAQINPKTYIPISPHSLPVTRTPVRERGDLQRREVTSNDRQNMYVTYLSHELRTGTL